MAFLLTIVAVEGRFLESGSLFPGNRSLEVIGDSIGVRFDTYGNGNKIAQAILRSEVLMQVGYGNLGNIEDTTTSNICLPNACGGEISCLNPDGFSWQTQVQKYLALPFF